MTDDPADLDAADRIVLPGVGAFPDAMANLRARGLDEALAKQVLHERAPFLGVCLGMQLMAAIGEEVRATQGLGWVDASVVRFVATAADPRIPHVGWNEVTPVGDSPLFTGIPAGADFYFVHSFHIACATPRMCSRPRRTAAGSLRQCNAATCIGVQFHPEKSQQWGLRLLANFLTV